jgi:hypothetical protein
MPLFTFGEFTNNYDENNTFISTSYKNPFLCKERVLFLENIHSLMEISFPFCVLRLSHRQVICVILSIHV